jgi:general stress protein 26
MTATDTITTTSSTTEAARRDKVLRTIARRSFCVLATSTPGGRPHAVSVLYAAVDRTLWVHTFRDTKKARNVAANPEVAVCIPVRRLPLGPAMAVQFTGRADVVDQDDPAVVPLIQSGRLKKILVDGALDEPTGVFLRITPHGRIGTYGIGVPLLRVIRDPLSAIGSVSL